MKKVDLLMHALDSTFDQESWFAPFKPSMEGITAEQAKWKPEGEATKSIWENASHLIYYKERLTAKLEGRDWTQNLDGDETFHYVPQSDEDEEWHQVVERAGKAHNQLREALSQLTDDQLEKESLDEKLLDIFLHDAYHTGQIIQIRKLQGSWPANR
ncbi:DinB family protein [Halobacillus litoralis]|uniref:DinB family protein n=1 Tax=Halobacillus litoralis TaxID=45668 RepID=UPI001CD674A3|nr:DinB family protein [Halobacillus litoralis]MCA0970799.1 DinB family protein [Halobacillus litoralis]